MPPNAPAAQSPLDPASPATSTGDPPLWPVLRRFLPYLWPRGNRGQQARIVVAGLLVLLSKTVQLSIAFILGALDGCIYLGR